MFDFIEAPLAAGESWRDTHHLGVQIQNPTDGWTTLTLRFGKGDIWLDLRLGPNEVVRLSDEQSSGVLVIENTGTVGLRVEWKKTRD